MNNLHQQGISLQGFVIDHHVYPLLRDMDRPKGEPIKTWIEALGGDRSASAGIWRCPSAQFPPDRPASSYAYNVWGSYFVKWTDLGLGGHHIPVLGTHESLAPAIGESEVVIPGDMMAIGDSFSGGDVFERHVADDAEWNRQAASRHQGIADVSFCDGHVESVTLNLLFRNTSDTALVRWNCDHQPHREQLP